MSQTDAEPALCTNEVQNIGALFAKLRVSELIEKNYEVVIIGGGVVGAATAAALGRDGRKVLLIERDWAEPDRIVGELLQPGGIKALESLGLSASIEGIDGILTEGYAIMRGKETVVLKYPEDLSPRAGVAFHHGRFVTNLRRAALETRNVHGVQGIATELIKCPETNRVIGVRGISSHDGDLESGENQKKVWEVYAPLTIAADGCFSRFRNEFVPKSNVEVKSHFAGLILTDCPLPHPNHGHVILAEPSPVLLYQIGSRDTRILVDIPGKVKINRYMRENVYPQLPEQIQGKFIEALESNGIRSMPNSWLPPTLQKQEGLILIGDAMNMRHPLTGGGMTVGLWDVVHIRSLLRQFPELSSAEPSKILLRMRTEHFSNRRPLASVINITAMGLYGMFAAGDDPQASILKETMFNYLKNGQKASFAPMGLLGGLIPSRYTLFVHFFAILFSSTKLGFSKTFRRVEWEIDGHDPKEVDSTEVPNNHMFAPIRQAFSDAMLLPFALLQIVLVLFSALKLMIPVLSKELFTL